MLPVNRFRTQAKNGTLPSVSWIAPTSNVSDHPAGGSTTRTAMAYVTRLINTVMQGPDWGSTAIFLVWDDWGGFYDHLEPPRVDNMGYGLRVPSLVISPYAKRGFVDSRLYTFDSYLKLIEDRFLGGERLDPATLSRPDGRKHVRERHRQGPAQLVRLHAGAAAAAHPRPLAMEGPRALPVVLIYVRSGPPVAEREHLVGPVEVERLTSAAAVQHHELVLAVAVHVDRGRGVAAAVGARGRLAAARSGGRYRR